MYRHFSSTHIVVPVSIDMVNKWRGENNSATHISVPLQMFVDEPKRSNHSYNREESCDNPPNLRERGKAYL